MSKVEHSPRRHLKDICKARDIAEYLRRCLEAAESLDESPRNAIENLVGEARLLDAMARHLDRPELSKCLLVLRQLGGPHSNVVPSWLLGTGFAYGPPDEDIFELAPLPGALPGVSPGARSISKKFQCTWLDSFDVQGAWLEEHRAWTFRVQGPGAAEMCALQEGWILCWELAGAESEKGTQLFLSERVLVPPGEPIASVLSAHFRRRAKWIEDLAAGRAPLEQDPIQRKPVIRIFNSPFSLDLRTDAMSVGTDLDPREIILPLLPLPPEIAEARR